ncbi:MAG: alpha-amylase [Chloroflexi bacterium HGW-Chloroflexi-5]|jgi:glycosidase|nr:MAG: alpha-amylase [Chloroflexi bacterium HGW-Chloroflexi-5]
MRFPITKRARAKYRFQTSLFAADGKVFLPDVKTLHSFVFHINQTINLHDHPGKTLKASQIHGMGLLDEIFHHVFNLYLQENPTIINRLFSSLQVTFAPSNMDILLNLFVKHYPPQDVYEERLTTQQYLARQGVTCSNQETALIDLILLWVSTQNQALIPFASLIWEPDVLIHPLFNPVLKYIEWSFSELPGFGPEKQALLDMLKSPSEKVPDSIPGQLEYIRIHWGFLLGDLLNFQLLNNFDLIKEEEKPGFTGPGPAEVLVYDSKTMSSSFSSSGFDREAKAFSLDCDWMPGLVLIAKNIFVWLEQLSKKYNLSITTLEQIPDDELMNLQAHGINGLWLIGLWQRSPASARIKQLTGNPEAVSSAYSLYSYRIAEELGGDAAYEILKQKAEKFGIRLASDMVPNHMGIDSEWVIQHPEWFLSVNESPFPSYSFNGTDLSSDENILIQIEDHYYDRSDAAVVFRRTDKRTGISKYIYHGNDGTAMPWNDTAQLNYIDPAVREIVIQTIIEIARKFPIIRFDAAMTLAKKHIQRLWYPEPGSGGAIPSRSNHSITQYNFDQALPKEFWREVVERVEKEVPGTLLLAEAFWLMEGYFVRTLGMHRVYNSAFMHMLRDEDNAGYRKLIKNTLEFDPEILERFVNFMNNPDERTAIDQFGSGDKYFGVCTLMVTLPGLPMFGHGQIEGLTEKYGMEYRKPKLDETGVYELDKQHFNKISPLLQNRELFASADHFRLFDFQQPDGNINENVFAFTNQYGKHRVFVLFNNSYQETDGKVVNSFPHTDAADRHTGKYSLNIAAAFGLFTENHRYLCLHDLSTDCYQIRLSNQIVEHGFETHLNGYEYHVFTKVQSSDQLNDETLRQLYEIYGQNPIPNLQQALNQIYGERNDPVRTNADLVVRVIECVQQSRSSDKPDNSQHLAEAVTAYLENVKEISNIQDDLSQLQAEIMQMLTTLLQIPKLAKSLNVPGTKNVSTHLKKISTDLNENYSRTLSLTVWVLVSQFHKHISTLSSPSDGIDWINSWNLDQSIKIALSKSGISEDAAEHKTAFLKLAIKYQDWFIEGCTMNHSQILKGWLITPDIRESLKVNYYEEILWYHQESFMELIWWMEIMPIMKAFSDQESNRVTAAETVISLKDIFKKIQTRHQKSYCKVDLLLASKDLP